MKVERITTYERFVEVRIEWNTLLSRSGQNNPFLTHQWFDAWWQSFGQENALEILFFRDESASPAGIAPLMTSDGVLKFIASHEVTDYCDFISCVDNRVEFYENLSDHFQRNSVEWSRIELINIPGASPTLSELPRLAGRHGFICVVEESEIVPILILPESYEEYMHSLGRKNRHELRRKLRKLEALGQICIRQIKEPEKLRDSIEAFVSLHRASNLEKQEFWRKQGMSDFFHELSGFFSSENWAELLVLYVRDRMIAALLNFHYENTLYFYNIAYDKDFSPYSPGFFLFHHSIEQAIAKNLEFVDFLRGREKYKYFFGAKESKIFSLNLKQREKKT